MSTRETRKPGASDCRAQECLGKATKNPDPSGSGFHRRVTRRGPDTRSNEPRRDQCTWQSPHLDGHRTSTIISTSTGAPSGNSATPTADRAC